MLHKGERVLLHRATTLNIDLLCFVAQVIAIITIPSIGAIPMLWEREIQFNSKHELMLRKSYWKSWCGDETK